MLRQIMDWWRGPMPRYHFDERYFEPTRLADETRAILRVVRPADRVLIEEGFQELSCRSRYHRFMGARSRLTPGELRYLSEFDGLDHFALGAVTVGPDGRERGLGIARFVRLKSNPSDAEPAVAVLDEMQGRGLGRLLVERLAMAATERGIERFRAQMLASNAAARALLRRLAPDAEYRIDEGALEVSLALPLRAAPALPRSRPTQMPPTRLVPSRTSAGRASLPSRRGA